MLLSRLGLVAVLVAVPTAATTAPRLPDAAPALVGDDFPAALLALVTVVVAVLSTWVLLIVVAEAASWPGLAPAAVRAALFVGVTAAVGAAPAHADGSHDLDGLPLPDRPVVSSSSAVEPVTAGVVTVRPGDTLWRLAADQLPDDASLADVAAACRAWHHTNRAVIGPDPDLILPGQQLTPPQLENEDPT